VTVECTALQVNLSTI